MNDRIAQLLKRATGTSEGWEEMEGPETGVGVEYWYYHAGSGYEAYVVDDQGHLTVEVSSREDRPVVDDFADVKPRTIAELVALRDQAQKDAHENYGSRSDSYDFTCDGCRHVVVCPLAFDLYNTDGDCLMLK